MQYFQLKRPLWIFLLASLLTACNWVQLTTEGETVRLATAAEVGNCRSIGRASSQTLDEVVFVDRGADTLQEELLTLARNEAGSMGGNVIVPESLIDEGEQSFMVYSCP